MHHFDWSGIPGALPTLWTGAIVTLKITLIAIVFGIIWGTILAMLRLSSFKPFEWFAKGYVTIFRSIPLVMVLLWFFLIVPQVLQNVLGLSPDIDIRLASAMVAFSLFEAAYYSEIIRAGIQSVPRGQVNAAFALGMTLRAVDASDRAAAGVPRDGAAAAHAGYCAVSGYVARLCDQPRRLLPHRHEYWRS